MAKRIPLLVFFFFFFRLFALYILHHNYRILTNVFCVAQTNFLAISAVSNYVSAIELEQYKEAFVVRLESRWCQSSNQIQSDNVNRKQLWTSPDSVLETRVWLATLKMVFIFVTWHTSGRSRNGVFSLTKFVALGIFSARGGGGGTKHPCSLCSSDI